MSWLHTLALPLVTMLAVSMGIKKKAPYWKHGALILGCALMLGGLWLVEEWSTFLLVGGGVLFLAGVPRGLTVRQTTPASVVAPPVAGEPGVASIHISFPSPRFFMGDAQVVLLFDGTTVHEGGFRAGIDVTIPAAPGQHRLESVIELGIAKRRRSWAVAVPTSGCDVILEYSRFWGNFAKGVRIGSPVAPGPSADAA